MNTKAIFTILYGEKYVSQWKTYAEASWRAYAQKHGYDIILVTSPIQQRHDLSFRAIHWQKLFIASHPDARKYEKIVFLDSDIIINYHRAPCIVSANNSDKIGAVRFDRYIDDSSRYSLIFLRQARFVNYQLRSEQRIKQPSLSATLSGPDYSATYREWTDRPWEIPLLNSGVLVIDPHRHRELLEGIYDQSVKDVASDEVRGKAYEQGYVMYSLFKAGMINFMDERFNTISHLEIPLHYPFLALIEDERLVQICYTTILCNSYFMHFAGEADSMKYAICNDDNDFAILGLKDVYKGDVEVMLNHPSRCP